LTKKLATAVVVIGRNPLKVGLGTRGGRFGISLKRVATITKIIILIAKTTIAIVTVKIATIAIAIVTTTIIAKVLGD